MKSDFSVSVTLQSEEVKLRFRTMSYSNYATLYLLIKGPLSSRMLTFVRVSINSQAFCRWSDSLTDLSYFVHQDNNHNLNGSLRAMKSHCQTYTESPPVFVLTSCLLKLTMSHMEAETHEGIHKNETRSAQLRSLLEQTKTTSCNIHFFSIRWLPTSAPSLRRCCCVNRDSKDLRFEDMRQAWGSLQGLQKVHSTVGWEHVHRIQKRTIFHLLPGIQNLTSCNRLN